MLESIIAKDKEKLDGAESLVNTNLYPEKKIRDTGHPVGRS